MPERRAPLEKTIVANVMAVAKSLGYWSMKTHGSSYAVRGTPDVLAIKDGKASWMEVKRPGEHPTRAQEHVMRQLAAAGCRVTVVYSAADARHFLEGEH